MKKTILVVMACIMFTSLSFASNYAGPANVSINKNGKLVEVSYKSDLKSDVTVSIYNSRNKKVFTETLYNMDAFKRPYNLSSLPEDNYTVKVTDRSGNEIQSVMHTVAKPETHYRLIPLQGDEGKYILSAASKTRGELNINIYDVHQRNIYSANANIEKEYAMLLNMTKHKGKFTVEVSDKEGASKIFEIEVQ